MTDSFSRTRPPATRQDYVRLEFWSTLEVPLTHHGLPSSRRNNVAILAPSPCPLPRWGRGIQSGMCFSAPLPWDMGTLLDWVGGAGAVSLPEATRATRRSR
jgi:hypothetical protein